MPKYRVVITVETVDQFDPDKYSGDVPEALVIADHVCRAVKSWGGQNRPDDYLFPTNIAKVTATCREQVVYIDNVGEG
jgi:hypothetical protein